MKKKNSSAGFTIIEVLIASLVFAVVLIICLEGVTRIGKLYYKGVSSAKTQELIRNLSTDFTQQVQFGGKDPIRVANNNNPSTPLIFCVGDYRYRAIMNKRLGDVPSILKRVIYSGNCVTTDTGFENGVELAAKGMRLQRLKVISSTTEPRLWTVDIRVAIGEDDMFEYPTGNSDDAVVYEEAQCKSGISGSEFCATAALKTSVIRRIR